MLATPAQMLLLRACLSNEQSAARTAAEYWLRAHWQDETGFTPDLDLGSHRLLPLFYRTCKAYVPPAVKSALQQIHLDYWAQNKQRMLLLARALAWFQARGIPTLVLKGAAIATLYYDNPAVRPMGDFDILIPDAMAAATLRTMRNEGWDAVWSPVAMMDSNYFIRYCHAVEMRHPDVAEMDLHWHALHAATFHDADREFWDAAIPLDILGAATRTPCATDTLLQMFVHGDRADLVPTIRWIADAHTILRKTQVDWDRLVRLATDLEVTFPVARMLGFLRRHFCPDVPERVLRELESVPVSERARKLFDFHANRTLLNRPDTLRYILECHRRATRDLPTLSRFALLPLQFQQYWHVPTLGGVPKHLWHLARQTPTPKPLVPGVFR